MKKSILLLLSAISSFAMGQNTVYVENLTSCTLAISISFEEVSTCLSGSQTFMVTPGMHEITLAAPVETNPFTVNGARAWEAGIIPSISQIGYVNPTGWTICQMLGLVNSMTFTACGSTSTITWSGTANHSVLTIS
ncbi:MAG: hypothetical protein ACI8ZM_003092 [Crocinitomix sp.]|jgi:hypothetical protein